jgi:transcriptional regulator with XRE-family HTH domain
MRQALKLALRITKSARMKERYSFMDRKAGQNKMMIKRVKSTTRDDSFTPKYRSRGSKTRGIGLSDYQKTQMKERRESLGLSQTEVGERIAQLEGLDEPVAQATISNLEKIDPKGRVPSRASKHLRSIEQILRFPAGFLEPARQQVRALKPVIMPNQAPIPPAPEVESYADIPRPMAPLDGGASRADMPAVAALPTVEQATARTFGALPDLPVYFSTYGPNGVMSLSIDAAEYMQRPGKLATVQRAYAVRIVSGFHMEPKYVPGDVVFVNPFMATVPSKSICLRKQQDGGEILIGQLVAETATDWTLQQLNPARAQTVSKSDWPIAHRIIGVYEE